jgi:hypothetical protein
MHEIVAKWRMAAATSVRFVMNVPLWMLTADRAAIDIRRDEMKHLGLAVIDPEQ